MKYYFLFSFILYLSSQQVMSQTVDFKLFDGKVSKINKEIKTHQKNYKKIRKEQKAYLRKQKRTYRSLQDSVNSLSVDSLTRAYGEDSVKHLLATQEKYFTYTDTLYTLSEMQSWDAAEQDTKQETLTYAQDKLDGVYYYDRFKSQQEELLGYHQELKVFKDSLNTTEIDSYEREYLLEKRKGELAKKYNKSMEDRVVKEAQQRELIPLPMTSPELEEVQKYDDVLSTMNPTHALENANLHGLENFKEGDVLEVAKTQGMSYFEGQEEVLANEIENMQKLKEKYHSVKSSADLSKAKKKSSLKGDGFGKRLVFGGTFKIYIDEFIALDLNPELSFLINKKFSIGVGGTYRLNAKALDLAQNVYDQSIFGYRAYTEHELLKAIFLHAEYELLSVSQPILNTDKLIQSWNPSILAGIEKRIRIGSDLEGQVAILYNFMHKDNPAYERPFVVRVGFNYAPFSGN